MRDRGGRIVDARDLVVPRECRVRIVFGDGGRRLLLPGATRARLRPRRERRPHINTSGTIASAAVRASRASISANALATHAPFSMPVEHGRARVSIPYRISFAVAPPYSVWPECGPPHTRREFVADRALRHDDRHRNCSCREARHLRDMEDEPTNRSGGPRRHEAMHMPSAEVIVDHAPAWLTVSQLCRRWQLDRKTVYKFIDAELLPAWRVGPHLYRVSVADVLHFESRNRILPK